MAISAPRVLVEGTSYRNTNIGVQRVYEGALTAQAIARGADQIAGKAFRFAAEDAQRQGQEMALAVDTSEIIGIDPNTGAPVALNQMQGMGRIGSEAYTRVVQSRYAQSIEEEITNQGRILAEQYANNPDGPALFTTAMSEYLSSMSQHATGMWQGIIEDVGTSYINQTRSVMTAREMRAQRARLASGGARARGQALTGIRAAAAAGQFAGYAPTGETTLGYTDPFDSVAQEAGPDLTFGDVGRAETETSPMALATGDMGAPALSFGSVAQPSEIFPRGSLAESIDFGVRVGLVDEIAAQIVPESAMADWDRSSRMAAFEGAVEFLIGQTDFTDPDSVDRLNAMEAAISMNNVSEFMRLAPELRSFAPFLIADRDALDDVRAAVDGLLTNASDYAEYASADRLEAQRLAQAQLRVSMLASIEQASSETSNYLRLALAAGDLSAIDAVRQEVVFGALPDLQGQVFAATSDEDRTAVQERLDVLIDGTVRGIVRGLASGQGQDEIRLLQSRILNGDTGEMTAAQRSAYNMLLSITSYRPDVLDDVNAELSTLHGSAAAGQDLLDEEAALRLAQETIVPAFDQMRALPYSEIGEFHRQIIDAIRVSNLSDTDASGYEQQAHLVAAQTALVGAMEIAATFGEEQVALAGRFAAAGGPRPEGLVQPVYEAIEQAIRYGDLSGRIDFVRSNASVYAQDQLEIIAERQAERERRISIAQALTGYANPGTAAGRQAADEALGLIYRRVQEEQQGAGLAPPSISGAAGPLAEPLQAELPPDLFTNPQYVQDPIFGEVINRALSTPNFMPTSLLNALTTVASGTPVRGMPTIVSHWRQVRNLEQGGVVTINPAVTRSMSDEDIAMLNMLASAEPLYGSEGIVEAVSNYARYLSSQDGRVPVAVDGVALNEFLPTLDGWDEFSPELRAAVGSVAVRMAELSRATEGQFGHGESWLRGELNDLLDRVYPDSGGIVMQTDSTGRLTSRTAFPLERELGVRDQRTFLNYIAMDIQRDSGLTIRMTGLPVGADERVALEIAGAVGEESAAQADVPFAFLTPYGRARDGGIAYAVVTLNPQTLEAAPVLRPDGLGPYIYSTNESGFRSILESRIDRDALMRQGQAQRDLFIRMREDPGGIELMGVE